MKLRKLRERALAQLRRANVDGPELGVRVLLSHSLGLSGAQMMCDPDREIADAEAARVLDLVGRRAAGEPVARILGVREFWSRPFRLGPDTLVPRPESETVVEAALAARPDRSAPLRVLDLGVGSGNLLGAILLERPNASGIGIDRSEASLEIARCNLDAIGVGARAKLVQGDWGRSLDERFDLIVANPPYLRSDEIERLAVEVRAHDPRVALDGGPDGLEAYRAICDDLPRLLKGDGIAVLELGEGQEGEVAAVARDAQLSVNGVARRDLENRPRALLLTRKKTLGDGSDPH